MSKTATNPEKTEALANLREWLPKGSTVYTILRGVSRSGISRDIGLVILCADESGKPFFRHPNHAAATVLGLSLKRDAMRVIGCGMDMGFHIVSTLSRALYGDDYAIKHEWL